jgi:bifunctional non-homologous end joining protein LigD
MTTTLERKRPSRQRATNSAERNVPVGNLQKVFYPKSGFTKGQVIDYYKEIAPALLPHLKDRPLTLKRYPNGVEGPFFYERRCPDYRPKWMGTATLHSSQHNGPIDYCVINNLASLIWVANLADLELHTFLSRKPRLPSPTTMVFDLDPGAPATVLQCAEVALWLRKAFEQLKLESFVKTSGSKGLQVYVPLNTPTTFEATAAFARQVAELMQEQNPELVVAKMNKDLRKGKVLVDWSQNQAHKTTVCVYSLRAKEQPTVSTPVTWEEISAARKKKDPACLTFLSDEVLRRVDKRGDIFAPVLKLKQKLPRL